MQGTMNVSGAPHALPRGTLLQGGRYRIEQTLGYGGFAITYLAYDSVLNRLVAVKELLPDGCAREPHTLSVSPQRLTTNQFEQIRQRFVEEAQLLAQLNHQSIVRVYDVFEAHNTAYIVMEYLHGQTLSQLLQERGGVMPEQEAVEYIFQICDALQVVHQRGYLHRDIKPSNIIVTHEGRAVLIDFGAAREFTAGQTRAYTMMLTPTYAALEQYGATTKLDERTDLYALGATLYHLVTGQPPLPAPDRARGLPLPAPHQIAPEVSEGVSRAIVHAMGLHPEERPASVRDWGNELRQAIGLAKPPPLQPPNQPPPQTPARSAQKTRGALSLTLGILGLVSLFIVLFIALRNIVDSAAQSQPNTWFSPPSELTLAPPQAGSAIDLNESVSRIASGGVIYLEPGTYILSRPIRVNKPLRLTGKGNRGEVVLKLENAPEDAPYVISCESDGVVTLENIEFVYHGSAPARVCQVVSGEASIMRCVFRGGVWNEQKRVGGSGVVLFSDSRAAIRDSVFVNNGLHGIEAQNSARLTAEGNTCEENKEAGIALLKNAQGEARNNLCRNNGLHGIAAQDSARLTAEGNVCENNQQSGIIFWHKTTGEARDNTCRFNQWGISVKRDALPVIGDNTLYSNTVKDLDDWRW